MEDDASQEGHRPPRPVVGQFLLDGVELMLVLTRRVGEEIQIGDGITVTVVKITNQGVRIGISASLDENVAREELVLKDPCGTPLQGEPLRPEA